MENVEMVPEIGGGKKRLKSLDVAPKENPSGQTAGPV